MITDGAAAFFDDAVFAEAARRVMSTGAAESLASFALKAGNATTSASLVLDPKTGGNLIAFKTAIENGLAESYVGFAGDGTPAAIVVSLGAGVTRVDSR